MTLHEQVLLRGPRSWLLCFYEGPIEAIHESAEERHTRLLKKYRTAIELREDWGSIDQDEIVRIADKELSE